MNSIQTDKLNAMLAGQSVILSDEDCAAIEASDHPQILNFVTDFNPAQCGLLDKFVGQILGKEEGALSGWDSVIA